eukprot:Nitzschia sp. Nitz4//scaffold31_size150131//43543//44638//NITZ4_002817-RA/size150131-processed-gene-0.128-mRNA-1//-1//CDS//3329547626//794//frame0
MTSAPITSHRLFSSGSDVTSTTSHHDLPPLTELQQALEVATQASRRAGEIILEHTNGSPVVETKSTSRDLLTTVDPLCEKVIRETIQNAFPPHDFLGEEGVEPGIGASTAALEKLLTSPTSPWLFLVDPIDGTTNFATGIPLNLPSIAVAYQGQVVVGVLYDPHRDELYTAIKGQGAFCNGKPIRVSTQEVTLGQASIGMESPAGQESLDQCVKSIPTLMPKVRTIRMLGSSAIMLPWVAQGRLTGYWTPDECAWDIAAGALIVQEAGGRVTDLQGNDYSLRTRFLVASNGIIHDDLLHLLQKDLL